VPPQSGSACLEGSDDSRQDFDGVAGQIAPPVNFNLTILGTDLYYGDVTRARIGMQSVHEFGRVQLWESLSEQDDVRWRGRDDA
jgi:hypothetical protein